MADCAKKVIRRNGFENRIKIIPKRSTDLKIGTDIPHRANVLVTEVFDTELIGEGAILTYNHALAELMTVKKYSNMVFSVKNKIVRSIIFRKTVIAFQNQQQCTLWWFIVHLLQTSIF